MHIVRFILRQVRSFRFDASIRPPVADKLVTKLTYSVFGYRFAVKDKITSTIFIERTNFKLFITFFVLGWRATYLGPDHFVNGGTDTAYN